MKSVLIRLGLVLLLIFIGFVTHRGFVELSISLLDLNGISRVVNSLNGQFNEGVFFSVALGIIPLILFGVNKINVDLSGVRNKYLIPLGIIILIGVISWMLRIFILNSNIEKMNSFDLGENIQQTLSFDTFNFSIYLLVGFIIGGIVSVPVTRILK